MSEEQKKVLAEVMGKDKKIKKPTNARPATSYVQPKASNNSGFKYRDYLKHQEMYSKQAKKGGVPSEMRKRARPNTAKPKPDDISSKLNPNSKERDDFIEKKLKALQEVERAIDEDILNFKQKNIAKTAAEEPKKGIVVTKELLLQKSFCEKLEEIECLVLRELNIQKFDSTKDLDLDDMVNIECLYMSHNLLNDLYGVAKLTTLVELNLNNNDISDVLPLEDLTNLEKLYLAHNKIGEISGLVNLKKLQIISLFDNDIYHEQSTLDTLLQLPKLRELSIGNNPVNAKEGFKYHLILKLNLELLEDDKISELDRDIAKMYYKREGIDLPEPKKNVGKKGKYF